MKGEPRAHVSSCHCEPHLAWGPASLPQVLIGDVEEAPSACVPSTTPSGGAGPSREENFTTGSCRPRRALLHAEARTGGVPRISSTRYCWEDLEQLVHRGVLAGRWNPSYFTVTVGVAASPEPGGMGV